ncbi:sulfite reductase [NADPH] flavoprotein component [Scheffersomyces xylosifermentans]|uniref:sulfite reductase [NADPH] flavoprotein component n=1 Tax=Scheffersomyces xylosifermentans TaxID=1304137 RepID=UPI00315DFED7
MAPHALAGETAVTGSSSSSVVEVDSETAALINASPFGATVDPNLVRGTIYTSASIIINQAIYSIASKIFSYETVGTDNLLDSHIQLWSQNFHRKNSFGVVPFYHKLQVRSGASNAILGYFKKNGTNGQPVATLVGANALTYMRTSLAGKTAESLPLAFNVSAIDFDTASNSLVSNYVAPLNVARSLGYSVITPVNSASGLELQHLTVLNHYIVSLTGLPSLNLFDGPEFSKTYSKYLRLLSIEDLGHLYQNLLKETNTNPSSLDEAIDIAFENLNKLTGSQYSQFEYVGPRNPETVFVVYGSHESTQVGNLIEAGVPGVGLIKVRVPLPFNQAKFIEAIPESTRKLVTLTQVDGGATSPLKGDITAALFLGGRYHSLSISEFSYPLKFDWTPITVSKILSEFVPSFNPELALNATIPPTINAAITANTSPAGKYLVWGKDNGVLVNTADKLALSLSLDDSKTVSVRNKFDTTRAGGIIQSSIVSTYNNNPIPTVDSADVVIIEDVALLSSYDILATVAPGGTVLLGNFKGIKESVEVDVVEKLPLEFRRTLARNHNKLTVVDFSIVDELDELNASTKGFSTDFLVQLGFWRAALPELDGFIVNKLLQANGNGFELLAAVLDKFINIVDEKAGLKSVPVLPEWVDLEEPIAEKEEEKKDEEMKEAEEEEKKTEEESEEEEPEELPFFVTESSLFPNPRTAPPNGEETNLVGYKSLASKLTFPEAYHVSKDLRPDLPVKNFIAKVQENKRLTPQEYSRNIFHIEFDITGTGLTYDIGEALGIHGRNSDAEVDEFLKFYGVDGDQLVEVSNKDDATIVEIRTARQALTDSVDFLGKPPKRFYESLAEFAEDEEEKKKLTILASAEGAEALKKKQEVDFDTYVDILTEFPSARPVFSDLIKIIAPLKRREYSIASSQKLHPNAVHLLIVVVDWVDSRGRIRYGHCSKYLSDLRIGQELVVSVKPSVMKLPPLSTQPIIMSGLGTGLAPFKAFIEEKIWQKQQGLEIGEIYLFLGSRHKKEEYLYGELWEAYKDAGVLTHIGAAFSRDQPQKIYIQDRIRESIEELTDAVVAKEGSFYLCGPTWPVPDITACLEDIVVNGGKRAGQEVKDPAKVVEDMKEDGRYILEVY